MDLSTIIKTIQSLLNEFWSLLRGGALPNFGSWNYALLAILSVLQGPVVPLFGAAAASVGLLRPGLVFLVIIAGNLTSDVLWYLLGRAGKIEWIIRHGKWLGINRQIVERMKLDIYDQAAKLVVLSKLTTGLTAPPLIASGLIRVPIRRWFLPLLIGEVVRTGVLMLIGYFAAESILKIEHSLTYLTIVSSILLLLVTIWWTGRTITRKEA